MATLLLLACMTLGQNEPPKTPIFTIHVRDEQTGRGVPLVELRTVHQVSYFTDSKGMVAFQEPGLMDQTVFFHISSHGYEYPKDGFGFRGKAMAITPGGKAELKIRRTNLAERLYRVTGAGIYRDTILAGERPPTRAPILNAQVLGSDSVMNTIYRGKLYWFWGDTHRPKYPLGNFNVPGAISTLPEQGGLDPAVGMDLHYFTGKDGFARACAPIPGKGPTWISGLVTIKNHTGAEEMFAHYVKIKPPMTVYERGLCRFDDEKGEFVRVAIFPEHAPGAPDGAHAFLHQEGSTNYVYYASPYPLCRVPADAKSLADPTAYQFFTCLPTSTILSEKTTVEAAKKATEPDPIARDHRGKPLFAWRANGMGWDDKQEREQLQRGNLKVEEKLLPMRDFFTAKPVQLTRGAVAWNTYRRRWVLVGNEIFGTSVLGEIWYAEADSPEGPWLHARKIITHDKYSFYNVKLHPYFDQNQGKTIYLEGTYTASFSGNPQSTPWYDYNQIMYRLQLDDHRLHLPVALYPGDTPTRPLVTHQEKTAPPRQPPRFFALDRPAPTTIAVLVTPRGELRVASQPGAGEQILFYAPPIEQNPPPPGTVPLFAYHLPGRQYPMYSTTALTGATRAEQPLCHVWESPWKDTCPWIKVEPPKP